MNNIDGNYIIAGNNPNYGGSLINQKYSPLQNITITNDQRGYCNKIFNDRIKTLLDNGVFPETLKLYARWRPIPPKLPKDQTPPMVVISSQRASWLKGLFLNMQQRKKPLRNYNNPNTFANGPVPWYAPRRSGRHLYILVHHSEYDDYEKNLKPFPNMTVVGYKYGENVQTLGGFGASRFAALAMAMELGYEKAWLVDDNVVHINGFPNTLTDVEKDLRDNIWAIGFGAATENYDLGTFFEGIKFSENYDFENAKPGLLQQVVLWNLNLLRANSFNISPYFSTSNEDVSSSNYLQKKGLEQRIVTTCSIIKLGCTAEKIEKPFPNPFNYTALLFYEKEKDVLIKDGNTKLSDYIKEVVIPHSQEPNNISPEITGVRAIEQILSEAVKKDWQPAKIFDPYLEFHDTRLMRISVEDIIHPATLSQTLLDS